MSTQRRDVADRVLVAALLALAALFAAWFAPTPDPWVALAVFMFIGPPRVVLSYMAFLAPAVVLTTSDRQPA